MANNWTLLCGGVDYSTYSPYDSWRVNSSARHRGSTASGVIDIYNKAVERPKCFQEVRLLHVASGTTLFGGVILDVEQEEIGPLLFRYRVSCIDYTKWLDHIPIGALTYPRTATPGTADQCVYEMIRDWVTTSVTVDPFGIPAPSISVPLTALPVVPTAYSASGGGRIYPSNIAVYGYTPNFIYVSQAIDYIAKLADAVWFIDYDKVFWFADAEVARVNGILNGPMVASTQTYYDQTYMGGGAVRGSVTVSLPTIDADNPHSYVPPAVAAANPQRTTYRKLKIRESAANTISGIHLKDYSEVSTAAAVEGPATRVSGTNTTPNQKLIGDGFTKWFPLYNQPVDPAHTTVQVYTPGGALDKTYTATDPTYKIKTEYVDGQPNQVTADDWVFVCTSNYGIRFTQAPADLKEIVVTYNYYSPAQNPENIAALAAEIAAREGYGSGWYYSVLGGSEFTSPVSLTDGTPYWFASQQIQLKRFGRFKYLASFESLLDGWRPGQQFFLVSANRGQKTGTGTYPTWGNPVAPYTTFIQRFFVTGTETVPHGADGTTLTRVEAASDIFGS